MWLCCVVCVGGVFVLLCCGVWFVLLVCVFVFVCVGVGAARVVLRFVYVCCGVLVCVFSVGSFV